MADTFSSEVIANKFNSRETACQSSLHKKSVKTTDIPLHIPAWLMLQTLRMAFPRTRTGTFVTPYILPHEAAVEQELACPLTKQLEEVIQGKTQEKVFS